MQIQNHFAMSQTFDIHKIAFMKFTCFESLVFQDTIQITSKLGLSPQCSRNLPNFSLSASKNSLILILSIIVNNNFLILHLLEIAKPRYQIAGTREVPEF